MASITAASLITAISRSSAPEASAAATISQTTQTTAADSLDRGKQALKSGDYETARKFFSAYLKDNPDSAEALFLAGNAFLGLKLYEEAAQSYLAAVKLEPSLWLAHKNLVIVYAAEGKWKAFDQERALIQDRRANGAAGLSSRDADLIEAFYVGKEQYKVLSYAELAGRFKMRYNFVHFGSDGKPDYWIACESDDVDQISFAKSHPKEAAAGQRSFSLDSYSAPTPTADGKSSTETHGTIKFYPDGEPTYEAVRSDVMKVLAHQAEPISSTTSRPTAAPETNPATPK